MPYNIQEKVRKKHRILPLDLVPLIDIVFLLLIFFMLTATFTIQSGIKINLPKASFREGEAEEKFTIYLTSDNILYLDQEKIELKHLSKKLKSLPGKGKKKALIIKADENARHGIVVQIMDIATSSGIDKLLIATEKKND